MREPPKSKWIRAGWIDAGDDDEDEVVDPVTGVWEGQCPRCYVYIRMPRTMLPPIHGGDDGWFKLHDIVVKPNEITASVGVNFANNPKVRLDRYSGAISISGKAGDYTGECQKFDPATMQKKF